MNADAKVGLKALQMCLRMTAFLGGQSSLTEEEESLLEGAVEVLAEAGYSEEEIIKIEGGETCGD